MVDGTEETKNKGFVIFLVVALALLAAYLITPFITYILLGLLIVYLLHPVHRKLSVVVKSKRVSGGILLLLAAVAIFGPVAFLTTEVITQANSFRDLNADDIVNRIDNGTRDLLAVVGLSSPNRPGELVVTATIEGAQNYLQENAQSLLTVAANVAIGMFILAFIIYYGLVDGSGFVRYARNALPLTETQSELLALEIKKVVDAVLLGQILSAIAQGALGALGLLLFGVPNVIFWGFVMTVLSVIPVLGAFLIWAPAGLWLLATGDTWQGIGLLAWGAIVVSNIDNVLKPQLVGRHASIHPMVVLVGVFGGLAQFGFIGFLIGPLLLSLFIAIVNFWTADYLPLYRPNHRKPIGPTPDTE